MPRYHRPERRNRNIGTSKQGHGQNNRLVIPERSADSHTYTERLTSYRKVRRRIQGESFLFVVEQTRDDCIHPCTPDDIEHVLAQLDLKQFDELRLIVLRQPKRKEEILHTAWGRLRYGFVFEGHQAPAIILEAIQIGSPLSWGRKLDTEDALEFERLRRDGHVFAESKRSYDAVMTLEACRATQLYRTLIHEIGHYIDYDQKVEQPLRDGRRRMAELELLDPDHALLNDHPVNLEWHRLLDEDLERWEELWDSFWKRPRTEREVFAHRYADDKRAELEARGVLPFPRRIKVLSIHQAGLRLQDFTPE